MLGAVGVNVGTRVLATREATSSDQYKLAILAAASEDAVKFDALNDLLPSPGTKDVDSGRDVREVMPTSGETAGGIHDIVPASEIIQRMVSEAEIALARVNLLS